MAIVIGTAASPAPPVVLSHPHRTKFQFFLHGEKAGLALKKNPR